MIYFRLFIFIFAAWCGIVEIAYSAENIESAEQIAISKSLKFQRNFPLFLKELRDLYSLPNRGDESVDNWNSFGKEIEEKELGGRPTSFEIVRKDLVNKRIYGISVLFKYPHFPAVLDFTFYKKSGVWDLIHLSFSLPRQNLDQYPRTDFVKLNKHFSVR